MTKPAASEPVLYSVSDAVATITLNRPDAMNALDTATKNGLRGAVERAATDTSIRCVVVTGNGRAFCAGQDLKEHVRNLETAPDLVWSTVEDHYTPIALGLATMDKPVIAALNGIAAGAGASIALACDFRIAAQSAGFKLAFTGIALSCDTGMSWTLPRLVGRTKAIELLMTPRTVQADEARELGLLHDVVPDGALPGAVADLASALAAGPTLAYASIKRSLVYAASHDLAESLAFEGVQMALTGRSQDHRNAVASFLAKQKPVFEGR
jgi:2-(1,2-epoxy-1,2-dihydrophenyl)acetyl-CoA isomerase